MSSSTLSLLVSTEYRNDIKSKSFWIGTFLLPLVAVAFGFIVGYMMDSSDAMKEMNSATGPKGEISDAQAIGMMTGVMLVIFIMVYGAQIFNKVKTEKTNRICEVLVSSIPGRTLMISKVISVALVGITQILVWAALIIGLIAVIYFFVPVRFEMTDVLSTRNFLLLTVALLYFIGGFMFYGSLFAACGAITDRNNENQSYMTVVTMVLMMSMYVGMFATDNSGSALARICFYLPFTSPSVGGVLGISGEASWWQTALSLVALFGGAMFMTSLAGKIYTSALLLKGKKFSPRDIIVFLRSK